MTTIYSVILFGGFLLFLLVSWYPVAVGACDEQICASIVSKCLLTEDCNCDIENCTCCRDCYECLGFYYMKCCSCFNLCPKKDIMTTMSNPSYVEDLKIQVKGLFSVLTSAPDEHKRWVAFNSPINVDSLFHDPKLNLLLNNVTVGTDEKEKYGSYVPTNISMNCTVAYMSNCMSTVSCRDHCTAMGASSYRWFHDGCCECVGPNCINYGINESRCSNCKLSMEQEDYLTIDLNRKDYGYGEDEPQYESNDLQMQDTPKALEKKTPDEIAKENAINDFKIEQIVPLV